MATGEIVITRIFEAPRELVWDAWTKPEHFTKWWGPKPFTAPDPKMEVKTGGNLLWAMQSPEGAKHFTAGTFREIDPPAKLVCDTWFADENGNKIKPPIPGVPEDWTGETTVAVTLEAIGEHTRMTIRQTGIPEGDIRNMSEAGWSTSLDKLHESLVDGRAMVLGREFDAPRELVWEAWTKPEHLEKWWGPDGFTDKTKELELKVGGVWHHDMIAADGTVFPNRTEYVEIVEPVRLVYKQGDDENHEMFRTTVTFMEFAGKTHVNMIAVFPNKEIRDKTVKKVGAIEGGKQTLARLAEYLKTIG